LHWFLGREATGNYPLSLSTTFSVFGDEKSPFLQGDIKVKLKF